MYKGTTPTIKFILPEAFDLGIINEIYVTLATMSGEVITTKTGDALEVDEHSVGVYLDQEETLALPKGRIAVQLNWTYEDEGKTKRACSPVISIAVKGNLLEEVLQ